MSKIVCLACVVLAGLAGCSRPGSDLTEEQKRGLEVLSKIADPKTDPLQERFSAAFVSVCNRGMDSPNREFMFAGIELKNEMDRRKDAAGGKVNEALATWAESEAAKSDTEIIAAWGKRSDASNPLKAP